MTVIATGLALCSAAWTSASQRLGAVWVAAQPGDYDPTSGRGADWGKAAPAGMLVWLFLGAALFLLIRSMNRHMKKVNRAAAAGEFGEEAKPTDSAGPSESAASGDAESLAVTPGAASGDVGTPPPDSTGDQ